MGESTHVSQAPDWRLSAGIGAVLVAQAWFDFAPEGPWGSRAFSRGVIGLVGLGLLYTSWFRATFFRRGVLPTIDRWADPETSLPRLAGAGVIFCVGAYLAGGVASNFVPEPTGMLLGLFGLMILLQAFYVWLVLGPLSDVDDGSAEAEE